jgi:hypothetical protein
MAVIAVGTGHRKVSRAAEVHAPAGELFDIVADPYRHAELDGSGTVTGIVGGPRRLALGVGHETLRLGTVMSFTLITVSF